MGLAGCKDYTYSDMIKDARESCEAQGLTLLSVDYTISHYRILSVTCETKPVILIGK